MPVSLENIWKLKYTRESRAGRVHWSSVTFCCAFTVSVICFCNYSAISVLRNICDATTSGNTFGLRDHFWSLMQVQRVTPCKIQVVTQLIQNCFSLLRRCECSWCNWQKNPTETQKRNLQMSQSLVWGENFCLQSNSLICSSVVQLAINFEEKMIFASTVKCRPWNIWGKEERN